MHIDQGGGTMSFGCFRKAQAKASEAVRPALVNSGSCEESMIRDPYEK